MNTIQLFESLDNNEKESMFVISFNWKYSNRDLTKDRMTSIDEFINSNPNMGARLMNILNLSDHSGNKYFNYIESITKDNFLMFRNAGNKTWDEFCKLRGY